MTIATHDVWRRCAALSRIGAAVAVLAVWGAAARAHPMGNFAICHYARLTACPNELRIHYVIDAAEIPTAGELRQMHAPGSLAPTPALLSDYAARRSADLLRSLVVQVNGNRVGVEAVSSRAVLSPGAGGLQTLRTVVDGRVRMGPNRREWRIDYKDTNFEGRTGWKEIVAETAPGVRLLSSSAGSVDRSHELTVYPVDQIPPQDIEAHLKVAPALAGAPHASHPQDQRGLAPVRAGPRTPRDAFTEAIGVRRLTTGQMVLGLLVALCLGGLHAAAPGHGKTMVAAWLVGSRGTIRHALILGLTVTVTHTAGVFALGLASLFASQYIVPERLQVWLSVVSGAAISVVGGWLLVDRLRHREEPDRAEGGHAHHHPGHSHAPDGPITSRGLIALGVSGGIVPCPSALVVLLSAVALHRIAYGLCLIVAFSAGLAAVLVAIGVLAVAAGERLALARVSPFLLERVLPVLGAATITIVGLALVAKTVYTGAP